MRIGLNLLFLIPDEVGGTETYATSLLNALAKRDRSNDYFLYINKESRAKSFPTETNFHTRHCPINARNRVMRFLWEQLLLPIQARKDQLDMMHSLGYISPFYLPCASLVTIHDLNYLYIPEAYTIFTRIVQKLFVSGSAFRADQVIVVSDFVKGQMIQDLGVSANKVVTIHEAVDREAFVEDLGSQWSRMQTHFDLQGPYIFALSSLSPHKNIDHLLEAYAIYNGRDRSKVKLVIGGHLPKIGPDLQELSKRLGIERDVIFTGYLSSDELRALLANAVLFVFPSLYEGFGLPVLEAMAVETPVVCARRGSLPEVGGDAAVFFDPSDPSELADVLNRVIADDEMRNQICERGRLNLTRFSWEKTAADTLALYEKVFKGR